MTIRFEPHTWLAACVSEYQTRRAPVLREFLGISPGFVLPFSGVSLSGFAGCLLGLSLSASSPRLSFPQVPPAATGFGREK